jgi:hypothetical protein
VHDRALQRRQDDEHQDRQRRGFALNWPAYRNVGVFQGGTNWMDARVFIDPSQAPLKKS